MMYVYIPCPIMLIALYLAFWRKYEKIMSKSLCISHGSEKKRGSSETGMSLAVNIGKTPSACPAL